MNIRFQTWRRFTNLASILAIPPVLFLFIQPDLGHWSHRLEIASYIFLFSLGGAGALVAVLRRAGMVRFTYSNTDKRTFLYKMSKQVAEMEQRHGRRFSNRYYESLDVKPPRKSEGKPSS